jgi:hypothetical protein
MRCFQCGQETESGNFCNSCGSPLILADYIARTLKEQLTTQLNDRDVLEAESAHRVFEKVMGWFKIFAILISIAIGILGVGGIWKIADWSSNVDKAKEQVLNTAADIKQTAEKTKLDIAHEADALKRDVEDSRTELQAAKQLAPEMESLRQQLGKATADIQAQQKVIASSENFVKEVFSSHVVEIFHVGQPPDDRYAIVPPAPGGDKTTVFLLLNTSPVSGTLQLQFHIFAQPPNSYFSIHNLIVYFWGQSLDALKQQQLSVSYFPDKSDKDIIQSLSIRDGRAFADGEPLPKFNQPDPDFKGDKWLDAQYHFLN